MDFFEYSQQQYQTQKAPLAERMRPRTLDEFVGQSQILAPGRLLRRAIQSDQLSSVIFYGPPGTGKTTLARIIANTTESQFLSINAVLAGVKSIRESIDSANEMIQQYQKRTILFIDEVHRFNKAQQDALLPHVENGTFILIGATTENPYFEVNKALVSRSRIFQLKSLGKEDVMALMEQALLDSERGFGKLSVVLKDEAKSHLAQVANGDARAALNALELAVISSEANEQNEIIIDLAVAEESIQQRAVLYDKDGDSHFDTISAFIKSIRGSDPDAALYWMAKMLYAGEDPRFIFRRMIILASEDIGMADPQALGVVTQASQAYDYVGMPEGRFHLAQACIYLSTAAKSNSCFAFFDAIAAVQQEKEDEVPNHLKDGNRDKKGFGHGQGYLYPHAYKDHWVEQQYLPEAIQGRSFYDPSDQGYESTIKFQVARRREAQLAVVLSVIDKEKQSEISYWEERTLGNSGELLANIRDMLFALVHIPRDAMVLNLKCGDGLILGELLRKAPEGSIYGTTLLQKEREILETQYQHTNLLARPTLITLPQEESLSFLSQYLEDGTLFDLIIGKNVLQSQGNKSDFLKHLQAILAPEGTIAFAEVLPRQGQRLSELLAEDIVSEDLRAKWIAAETQIYNDPQNTKVNWSPESLKAALTEEGITCRQWQIQEFSTPTYLQQKKIEAWFDLNAQTSQMSYGLHLLKLLSVKEVEFLKQKFETELSRKTVSWKTSYLFFTLSFHQ